MSTASAVKPLFWVGGTKKDLKALPDDVQDVVGYALYLAQTGGKHPDAKPLHGFGGAGVLEVVEEHKGNAYRAVYTVKFGQAVYALHAFQKKSASGIATRKQDLDLIRQRLALAQEHYRKEYES